MTTAPRPRRRGILFGFGATQLLILLLLLVGASAGGYFLYNRFAVPQTATTQQLQTQVVRRGNVIATVNSTGTVIAPNTARLSFRQTGTIAEINVTVGQTVRQGQQLARLDTSDLEITLRQQRANLATAQARLQALLAGASDSDLAAAQGTVSSAQNTLTTAQNNLQKLLTPPGADDVAAAASALEKARTALQTAQTNYDRVSWRGDIGSSPEAVALQNATADYNSALAAYNLRLAGPNVNDVANARSAVENAQQQLDSANRRLAALRAAPLETDVAQARASVQVAEAQVASAQLALDRAILRAPFDGVIQAINAAVGENVTAQIMTIVDPSTLRIDVAVDETDVARLNLQQPATITFDALPGQTFRGTVISIAPNATINQGVATYATGIGIINPQGLRAGLTANVTIAVDQRSDVLLAPNRAIRVQGRERTVQVQTANGVETRAVQIGLANDQVTEIRAGLAEGDVVVIPATQTRAGAPGVPGGGAPAGIPIPGR